MTTITHRTALAALVASLAATLPVPALAQDADPVSGSLDAIAILTEQPVNPPTPSVLEIVSTQPMSFGFVQIPKAAPEGNKCVYSISVAQAGTVTGYAEIDAAGTVIGTNSPETNCDWTTDGSTPVPRSLEYGLIGPVMPAGLLLYCDANRNVNYTVRYQNAAAGVFFAAPSLGRVAVYRGTESDTYDPTYTDLAGTPACAEGGGLTFFIGGELTVTRNALASESLTAVGTIQFEANY